MKKKTAKILSLILALIMMAALLCACSDDETSSDPEDITSEITADEGEEDTQSDEDTSDATSSKKKNTSSKTSSAKQSTSSKVTTSNQSTSSKKTSTDQSSSSKKSTTNTTSNSTANKVTLYVKDFGAKGDGVTDDGEAIFQAINELRSSPAGSVLEFEKGKTYYYENNSTKSGSKYILPYLFYFNGDSDLTVKGNGCLVKMGGYNTTYLRMEDCENITIDGFNLDYAVKPAFAATMTSINTSTGVAVVKADRDITLASGETFVPRRTMFGTVPTPDSRYYLWIKKYEMVDANARTVKVYFDMTKGTPWILSDSSKMNQYGLVLPMPHNGFAEADSNTALSFKIEYCSDLTFKNLNVYSNKYQTFMTRECEGTITYENVNFVRAPYDQNLYFSSWGDIYHPVHCRAKFIWKNCTNEHPYDDVVNVPGVTLYVGQKHSSTKITLCARDNFYHVPKIKVGDEITIINTSTGELIGRPKVKSISQQTKDGNAATVILDRQLPGLKEGENILAWDEDTVCDPKSEFINCTMDGTFRARTNLTFTNCRLHIRRFWIGLEAPEEGPVPRNILFKNCDLTGDSGVVWNIHSMNNINKNGYHVENIVFENCKGITMANVEKDNYDEVIIR